VQYDDPVRVSDWQWAEKYSAHDAIDGGIRADAKGKGENGYGGETWAPAKLSDSIAAIGDYGVKPIANPFFANQFFYLFDAAKLNPRGTLCFFGRHARTNVFLNQHFEVGMNFLVEICIHTISYEEISQETSDLHKERHTKYSLRRLQSLRDRPRNAAPTLGFEFELLPSSPGQTVVFRASVVFGVSPKGGNPTFFLHSV
jgi:hypothetical protein